MRTNNGDELYGKEFDHFCKKCSITCTPYIPQWNGFSKRMNKTLMEKARTMLIDVRIVQ